MFLSSYNISTDTVKYFQLKDIMLFKYGRENDIYITHPQLDIYVNFLCNYASANKKFLSFSLFYILSKSAKSDKSTVINSSIFYDIDFLVLLKRHICLLKTKCSALIIANFFCCLQQLQYGLSRLKIINKMKI